MWLLEGVHWQARGLATEGFDAGGRCDVATVREVDAEACPLCALACAQDQTGQ